MTHFRTSQYPLVSIIIPCFNARRWLAQAIRSARGQTYKNIEIIVVDDGSTDGSSAVVTQYEEHVRCLRTPRRGASAARNHGLQIARGEWIQFLDADDLLSQNKIAVQMNLAAQGPLNHLYTSSWCRFFGSTTDVAFDQRRLIEISDPLEWLTEKYRTSAIMPVHAWLVSRHLAASIGGWNEAITVNDDGEYFDRLVLAAEKIVHCPEACSYYRSGNEGTLSQRLSKDGLDSLFETQLQGAKRLLQCEDSSETRAACTAALMRIAHLAYPSHPHLSRRAESVAMQISDFKLRLAGGIMVQWIADIAGWRFAKRVQKLTRKLRGIN